MFPKLTTEIQLLIYTVFRLQVRYITSHNVPCIPKKKGVKKKNKCISRETERTTDIDAWLAASKKGGHIVHFSVVLLQFHYNKTVISRLMVTMSWKNRQHVKKSTNVQLFSSEECSKHPMTMIQKMCLTS